jgi:hypothetical protein
MHYEIVIALWNIHFSITSNDFPPLRKPPKQQVAAKEKGEILPKPSE